MMAVSIKDLLKDLTPEGLYADFIAVAKALGLTTTAWQPGEPIRGFADIFSKWMSTLWNANALPALRAQFLDYASGVWLTIVAWTMYLVFRKGETFAGGSLVIENREGGFWVIAPGDIRVENANGKTFTNTTGDTLNAYGGSGAYPTVTLDFEADEAGTASDTAIGEIVTYPTAPIVAPGAGVYARTNTKGWFGQDAEQDEPLKERCRDSTGMLSPAGAAAAYRYVATSTRRPDGTEPERLLVEKETDTAVNVNRAVVINAGSGAVNVYVASPSGAATGDLSTVDSDLYLVNQAIQTLVVPAGITATVASAVELPVQVVLALRVDRASNVTAEDAIAAATAALTPFFKTFPIGGRKLTAGGQGYLLLDEVRKVAGASSAGIFTAIPGNPFLADVEVDPTEVVVPTLIITASLVTQ